ncbi:MAG: TonB-dependent receptor, partial [Acidobacteriota bacterium]
MTSVLLAALLAISLSIDPVMSSEAEDASSDPAAQQQARNPKPVPPPHHEVTVTATRTPTEIRQLGRSVTVISADEIESRGLRNVKEVLETVPGISVVSAGSFGGQTSVFVRGGESNFNLVMIDGVPVNQPGGEYDFADLSTTNIDRIEIVKGPSTVLYGADAAIATINVITRSGTDADPTGHLQIEGGTFRSYNLSGSVTGGSDRFQYSLGALRSDTDGIHDFNSQYDRTDLSGKFSFKAAAGSTISGLVRYIDSRQHYPTDDSGAIVDPNDYRETAQSTYSVWYDRAIANRYGTRFQYGYHYYDSTSYTVEDNVTDFFTGSFETENSRHFVDWQNNIALGENNLVTAGLSFKKEQSLTADLDRRSIGFFAQDQFSVSERVFVTAGVRHDNNNRFSNFTTGSLDTAILLTDQWKLRGSIANGFRAPDFGEIIGFPEFGINGNSNLKPEKNISSDLGVDFFHAGGRLRLTGTFFYNQFSDLIEFTFLTAPGEPNFINVERARSAGTEIEVAYNLTATLWTGFNHTYTSTRVTDAGTVPGGNFVEGDR